MRRHHCRCYRNGRLCRSLVVTERRSTFAKPCVRAYRWPLSRTGARVIRTVANTPGGNWWLELLRRGLVMPTSSASAVIASRFDWDGGHLFPRPTHTLTVN